MAELPRFQRSTGIPGGIGGDRASPAQTGAGAFARTLEQAGGGLLDVGEALDRIQQTKEAAWISRATGEAEIYTDELETRLEQESQEGAPQHVEAFKKDWGAYRNKVLGAAPSKRARRALEVRFNSVESAAVRRRGRFQANAELAKRGADFDVALNGHVFAARRNPSEIDNILGRLEGDFDAASAWIPGDQLPELRAGAKARAVEAAAVGLIETRDFVGARIAVEDARLGGLMSAEQRSALLSRIEEGERLAFVDDESDAIVSEMGAASAARTDFASLTNAMIAQESGGRADAVSPKGAVGLMQLMPATAQEVARRLGVEYSPELLTDPQYNKMLGQAYLDEQLDRYSGNVALALAAYNAGPGRVDEWLSRFGDPRKGEITSAEWAAKIPFEETRDYVAKIGARLGGIATPEEILAERVATIDDPAVRARLERAVANKWELSETGRARARQMEEAQKAERVARLEIAVSRGQADYTDIEAAFAAGDIDSRQLVSLTKALDSETEGLSRARAKLQAGEPWNVYDDDDRKLIDKLYEHSEQSPEVAFGLTAATGIAPKKFVAEIRQGIQQGSADSYEIADNLLAQAPAAFERDGGGEIAKRIDEFRGYTRLGFSRDDAARKASRTDAERAEMAAFGEDIAKEMRNIDDEDVLNALPSIGRMFFTPTISDARRGRLRNDFEVAYREARASGVPRGEALAVASARLDRVWGLSEVNGTEEVMRFPPERYYPAGKDGHGYIREQAVADIVELTGGEPTELRFVSDLITEGDIRAGQPPRYRLFFVDQDGFPQQLAGYFRADPSAVTRAVTEERRGAFVEKADAAAELRRQREEVIERFKTEEQGSPLFRQLDLPQ